MKANARLFKLCEKKVMLKTVSKQFFVQCRQKGGKYQ